MPRNTIRLQSVGLCIFLLIFGKTYCESLTNENYAHESTGEEDSAFFALRSCHQVLRGDSGEFFSPDYLCSNPPLWCNWTIQVDPGKRVRLYLEDFTPGDACHLKLDQIHLDGVSEGHGVLEKCWQEEKYTSLSNTLHVVVLIGESPFLPHRGFYGRYQAFVPQITFKSDDNNWEGDWKWLDRDSEPRVTEATVARSSFTRYAPMKEDQPTQAVFMESPNYEEMYDYFDQPTSASNELPLEVEEPMRREGTFRASQMEVETWNMARSEDMAADEIHLEDHWTTDGIENHSGSHVGPASFLTVSPVMLVPTRSGRGASRSLSPLSHEKDDHTPTSSTRQPGRNPSKPSSAVRRNVDAHSQEPRAAHGMASDSDSEATVSRPVSALADERAENAIVETLVNVTLGEPLPTAESQGTTVAPLPDMVEPLSDSGGRGNTRNHTEMPHLPGGHLFEVSVELTFSADDDSDKQWDNLARSLLNLTKTLMYEKLEILSTPITIFDKRIKRLSAGVLYILWLQIGDGTEGQTVHRTIHAALHQLKSTNLHVRESTTGAVLVSVSIVDVNECGTQLVLCDINAVCVNHFGSYACECRAGFKDMSRLGTGGTLCVDLNAAGTVQPRPDEMVMVQQHSPDQQHPNPGCKLSVSPGAVQGIYVVGFLLGFLILLLLAAVGILYHRRHRGAFLVRCQSNTPPPALARKGNNNNNNDGDDGSSHMDRELPPPPPPIRRPREGWSHPKDCCPAVDLPLLHFSPLMPLDGYIEPREGAKM